MFQSSAGQKVLCEIREMFGTEKKLWRKKLEYDAGGKWGITEIFFIWLVSQISDSILIFYRRQNSLFQIWSLFSIDTVTLWVSDFYCFQVLTGFSSCQNILPLWYVSIHFIFILSQFRVQRKVTFQIFINKLFTKWVKQMTYFSGLYWLTT